MDNPIAGVFDTYELLERILLNLSTKSLFGVRRVSRTWNSLIDQSHALQKRMFLMADGEPLRPDQCNAIRKRSGAYRACLHLNPAVDFSFKKDQDHGQISNHTGHWIRSSTSEGEKKKYNLKYLKFYWHCKYAQNPAYRVPNATCNNMFITQPPITAIEYGLRRDRACTLYNPHGLTFKDVWEGMQRALQDFGFPAGANIRTQERLCFYMSLPLEDDARRQAYEECSVPPTESRESCGCTGALFCLRS